MKFSISSPLELSSPEHIVEEAEEAGLGHVAARALLEGGSEHGEQLRLTFEYSSEPFVTCATAGRSEEAKAFCCPPLQKLESEIGCVPSVTT